MELQEFIDNHVEDGDVYDSDTVNVKRVFRGDEEVNHKTVYQTSVWQIGDTEDYFEVTNSWSNSGYWGDPEHYEPEFRKVKPVKRMVEVTNWVDA